jgi:hypothetical protein
MKNIYKILLLTIIVAIVIAPLSVSANGKDSNDSKMPVYGSKSIVKSIWKYEQDLSAYSFDNGIAKKVYFLSLCSDGTYHQFVQVFPSNPSNFFRVKNYVLDGKWSERNGKLILEEYGKENEIEYSYLYSNFENIDNQVIREK